MPKRAAPTRPAFAGFGPRALDFFKALAFHQDKAWFEKNRALHDEEVRAPLALLIADLTAAFADEGLPLKGDPKTSIFRIHRDTRFAKDKRPYKTNGGAVLSRDGSKRAQGFLYLHLDPEGCFAAAGFWQPEPADILAIRRHMAAHPRAFRTLTGALAEAGLALAEGDPLSRLPKGFETVTDAGLGAALRARNLIVREDIAADRIVQSGLRDDLVAFAKRAEPLLRFGWTALDEAPR